MGTVFSEYEIRELGFRFKDDEEAIIAECVGSGEETMDTRVVSKKCRGVTKKKVVKPTGTGVKKYSMHMPWDVYVKLFGMENAKVIDGVKTYGINNTHGVFCLTEKVLDEDDNVKYKACPNCVVETGKAVKTENGAEEVAEMELEIAVSPDDYGNGLYEALDSELKEETVKTNWMKKFDPASVQVTSA